MALLDVRRPSAAQTFLPAAAPVRLWQIKGSPRVRIGRMLEHPSPSTHRRKRRRKTPAIVASLMAPPRLYQPGQAAPPGTRRVRDDRPRAWIQAGIPCLIPQINPRVIGIDPFWVDVERSYQTRRFWTSVSTMR